MKKVFSLFICSLALLQSRAQMKEIFYDDFSTNKNNWFTITKADASLKIEDGKYRVNGLKQWDLVSVFQYRLIVQMTSQ